MKFVVVKIDGSNYKVTAVNGNSDLMPIDKATSLAAELNASEEKLATLTAERDRLRAAVGYFFEVYDFLTDNGKFASRPYCIGKDVIDGLRTALSAKGDSNE